MGGDRGVLQEHEGERSLALDAYATDDARALVNAYFDAAGILVSSEHWAGQFLVRFGFHALGVFDAVGVFDPQFNRDRVRELIVKALDSELAEKHGEICCHACGQRSLVTHRHLYSYDVDKRAVWACPPCALYLREQSS